MSDSMKERFQRAHDVIEQIFVDCDYWNRHTRKAHEDPIDCDPDGELRRMLDWIDRTLRQMERAHD